MGQERDPAYSIRGNRFVGIARLCWDLLLRGTRTIDWMGRFSSRATVGSLGSVRNRRWRALVAGIFGLLVLLTFGAWGAAGRRGVPARPSSRLLAPVAGQTVAAPGVTAGQPLVARSRSRSIQVVSGAMVKRFAVSEPAGVIWLLRVIVPHGTRAKLTGAIPRVAGVAISTPRSTVPSETCQRRGVVDVCTQAEEACPMPAATWQFRLHKLAGPAGEIRLEFLVGQPPGRRSPAVRPVVAAHIRVPSGAVGLAASDGALWVAGFGVVSRLDRATGRVVAKIRTPGNGDYSQIAVGDGSVWITAGGGGGTVYRVDRSTDRVVSRIHVGGSVQGIAVGGGRVWVTRPVQGPGDLFRIDPQTDRVTGPAIKVGPGPSQVVYGSGAVWVQNTSPASVMRIDPATGHVATVVATRAVPYGSFVVGAIATGYGSLWTVANDYLTRIDPRSSLVQASIRIPRAQEIAIGAGEVWVLAAPRSSSAALFYAIKHTAALWEVDPTSNRIVGKSLRLDALQPIAIAADKRNVWLADYRKGTVTRFHLVGDRRSTPHQAP